MQGRPQPLMRRTATALLLFLVALNLAVFAIRLRSLFELGDLTSTTGVEGPMIYSIWKVTHQHPLYEDPHSVFFSNTLYNFLFYRAYAIPPALANLEGSEFLLVCRLTSAAFALLGAALSLKMTSTLGLLRDRNALLWASSASLLFWFGTSPVGWFVLSVRPDLGAVCFAALGLLCFLRFLAGGSSLILVGSSVSFFLAWCFKQSAVLTFGASLLVILAFRRGWKPILLQFLPFLAGVAITLFIGGPDYRFNIATVPSLGRVTLINPFTFATK